MLRPGGATIPETVRLKNHGGYRVRRVHTIRIGEGTFWDTTGEKINLKPGVSLIGSGQNQTIIVGSDIGKYKEFIYCRSDSSVDGNQEIAHLRLSGNNRLVIDGITIHNRNKVRVHH